MSYRFTDAAGEVVERSRQAPQADLVVRKVCAPCNNGWMAQLEGTVRPIASELIRGEKVRLGVGAQVTLGHWAAKTAVLFREYRAEAVVLDGADLEQVLRGSAPDGFHIRLGFRPQFAEAVDLLITTAFVISAEEAAEATVADQPLRSGAPNSFIATLAFGGLVVSVAGGPGFRRPERWIDGGQLPLMIWPPTMGGIEWPRFAHESPRRVRGSTCTYATLNSPNGYSVRQRRRPTARVSSGQCQPAGLTGGC